MHVTVFLKLTSSFKLWPDENTGPLARRIITLRSGLSIFSVSRFLRDSNIASDNEFLITSTHNIQMKYYVKKGLKSKPISVYTELFSKQLAFCNVSYEWDFFYNWDLFSLAFNTDVQNSHYSSDQRCSWKFPLYCWSSFGQTLLLTITGCSEIHVLIVAHFLAPIIRQAVANITLSISLACLLFWNHSRLRYVPGPQNRTFED